MRDRTKNAADVLIGASDRRADHDREEIARVASSALTVMATNDAVFGEALFACAGDDSLPLLDATPAMARISAAARDIGRAAVLDERLTRNMKRWIHAETEWARSRVAGLRFSSHHVLFAFLYQAATEERPDLMPLAVTTIARMAKIAESLYYAALGEDLAEEKSA